MAESAPFDPEKVIRALAAHGVRYVLVGALAARLQGFPRLTADIDITPSTEPDNMDRLSNALVTLDARVFTDGIPEGLAFDVTPAALGRADIWNLVTTAGRLGLVFRPAGTGGYEELMADAVGFAVYDTTMEVASLAAILRSKEAAARPQDLQDAAVLRAMLERDG